MSCTISNAMLFTCSKKGSKNNWVLKVIVINQQISKFLKYREAACRFSCQSKIIACFDNEFSSQEKNGEDFFFLVASNFQMDIALVFKNRNTEGSEIEQISRKFKKLHQDVDNTYSENYLLNICSTKRCLTKKKEQLLYYGQYAQLAYEMEQIEL